MSTAPPVLIAVDWGTTSLRAYLVDAQCSIIARTASDHGILRTGGNSFDDVLADTVAPWLADGPLPILLSGMIGSRQGWREAAYLRCPASPEDLARNLLAVETTNTALAGTMIRIVAGMDCLDEAGAPDVMRGEETQVLGALLATGHRDGLFVLPGTHSKWVHVAGGAVQTFRTFMTGEIFAALIDATILGRLAEGTAFDKPGFDQGVVMSRNAQLAEPSPGNLLHMAFSARTRALAGDITSAQVHSYLSGLLIGSEINAALATIDSQGSPQPAVHILADEPLLSRYQDAARLLGHELTSVPADTIVGAHLAIARAAGLVAE